MARTNALIMRMAWKNAKIHILGSISSEKTPCQKDLQPIIIDLRSTLQMWLNVSKTKWNQKQYGAKLHLQDSANITNQPSKWKNSSTMIITIEFQASTVYQSQQLLVIMSLIQAVICQVTYIQPYMVPMVLYMTVMVMQRVM